MQQNKAPSTAQHQQNPAQAVQYVCRLLRSYGIANLTPELVRQAKFDAPASCQPLLAALHDLVLLQLAELLQCDDPAAAATALGRLKQQLQQEALDHDDDTAAAMLPQPGRLLLLHSLSSWGCPPGLLAQLTLPQPSSRASLLALCWLISHTQLFDRALQQLQVPADLLPLLPPYPEDTCLTPEAQMHAQKAAAAVQRRHQHIQQLLQHQASPAGAAVATAAGAHHGSSSSKSSGGTGCWPAVQTAAHHVLASYRCATLRLQQLTCLVEAREKLLHKIQAVQQQQQQHSKAHGTTTTTTRNSTSPSKARAAGKPQVLTAFELHLLAHSALLQQHQEALSEAVRLLQAQQECKQHATVFFLWATSAVTEALQATGECDRGAAAAAGLGSTSTSAAAGPASFAYAGTAKKQQQAMASVSTPSLPAPSLQDVLPLVQQLPPAGSQLAVDVLNRLIQQLQQAAAAANIPVDRTDGAAAVVIQAAKQLSTAVQYCSITGDSQVGQQQQQQAAQAGARCTRTAAAAMAQAGILPLCSIQGLQHLPEDLQHTLQQQQDCQQLHHQRQQAHIPATQQLLQHCSWRRQHQQREDVKLTSLEGHDVEGGCATAVAALDEVQRLNMLALQVAKLLAKTRAANKQQLAAAAQEVLAADDSSDGQQIVIYEA